MAQLVERLLQIPEFRGSNPVINQQLYWTLCTVNCIQKTKIKEKESGNCPFKKSIWEVVISQIFWECSERLLPGVPNPANAEDLDRHRRKQENLKEHTAWQKQLSMSLKTSTSMIKTWLRLTPWLETWNIWNKNLLFWEMLENGGIQLNTNKVPLIQHLTSLVPNLFLQVYTWIKNLSY